MTYTSTNIERLRLSLLKVINILSMCQAGRSPCDYFSLAVQFHDKQERWFSRLNLDISGNGRFCIESLIHGCDSDVDRRHLTRKFCGPRFSWNSLRILVHLMIYMAKLPLAEENIAEANTP
ncbi:uncharacterized protein N7529_006410 [Penicillium soppii]|jgi:hypothetical protein|uniref:uncharacterized protein n=1 Tax=Penicillium soppii TaxID=69789 RepID=UPI00254993DD|nr:uncharacterized protein N7529_006410 [Penicillium soppii]KAJ5864494.1 hypothetical protein N7529_006410 [Penicillium soppii]